MKARAWCKGYARWLLLLAVGLASLGLQADEPVNPDKPFATTHLLLQLSDSDPAKQNIVLSVARNLIEHYQPDLVDIEITTFGPGVQLLYVDNERREEITSLISQGVRFSVCMNTIESIERRTGERPELLADILPVPVGVAHILERVDQGYTLVRP